MDNWAIGRKIISAVFNSRFYDSGIFGELIRFLLPRGNNFVCVWPRSGASERNCLTRTNSDNDHGWVVLIPREYVTEVKNHFCGYRSKRLGSSYQNPVYLRVGNIYNIDHLRSSRMILPISLICEGLVRMPLILFNPRKTQLVLGHSPKVCATKYAIPPSLSMQILRCALLSLAARKCGKRNVCSAILSSVCPPYAS